MIKHLTNKPQLFFTSKTYWGRSCDTPTITDHEILLGGAINWIQYHPVSYIIVGLRARLGQLDETRLFVMTEALAFQRRTGETINIVFSR